MNKKNFTYILALVTCCMLIIFLFINYRSVFDFLAKILRVLRPVIFGFVFAFILNKPFLLIKKIIQKNFNQNKKRNLKRGKRDKIINIISLVLVYTLFLLLISGIIWIVIPQFIRSFEMFSENISTYVTSFMSTTQNFYNKVNNSLPDKVNLLDKISETLETLPDMFKTIIFGAFDVTSSIITTVIDIFLGLIISIYFLIGKDKLLCQLKKILYAYFNKNRADRIDHAINYTCETFSNFVTGQIIEAFILGTLCGIGLSILRIEYAFLISVLVGVTSLIPVVGALIGTIPSALILLLVDYRQAIIFVIFIIILQQIEGNLIYPRVVGTKVGLPALWVLIAIIIGGGLGGILGMLAAVPIMSMIFDLTRKNVYKKLNEKEIKID